MKKKDVNKIKQILKEWRESHQTEYNEFLRTVDAAIRDGDTNDYGCQKNDGTLGTDLTAILRILNNLTLISRGCQRDAVLLALLQQQQIQS